MDADPDRLFSSNISSKNKKMRKKKKIKLDSDCEESDDGAVDLDEELLDENVHEKLIKSLKSTLKTKKRRREEDNNGMINANEELIAPEDRTSTITNILDFFDSTNKELVASVKSTIKQKTKKKKSSGDSVTTAPLSLTSSLKKPVVKRIQRETLYNNVKRDISKWNAVVEHNRVADQLVFPAPDNKTLRKKDKRDTDDFVPMTPLEEKMAALIHGEGYVEKRKAEIFGKKETKDDEEDKYVRTVEETLERHHELARLRAIQSYEMAKAKRKGKIKSKKYHRLQRREKIRQQMKDFEELQKTDPEAAMMKLEELNQARIEERMSLKHRNTSKWAKSQMVRAKYNRESRAELSDQLKISRDLTVKVAESSDEESDDDSDLEIPSLVKSAVTNPSPKMVDPTHFLEIRKAKEFEMKESPLEIGDKEILLEGVGDKSDDEEGELEHVKMIAEAFEDEDLITEFQNRKNTEIESSKPKDVDLTLPGWGEWGGKDLKPSRRKKKFVLKAPPPKPRKDSVLPHVIINEEVNTKIRQHQVKEVPFPFTRVADYEKTIRAPIGRTWLPEQAMKNLIAPKVITRLGAVIQPIGEEALAKKPSKKKTLTILK